MGIPTFLDHCAPLRSSRTINVGASTWIETTLMITLHQEIGLHARCTMEVGKGKDA